MSRRVVMRMWRCVSCKLGIDQPAEEDLPEGRVRAPEEKRANVLTQELVAPH